MIRHAQSQDLNKILAIYEIAKHFMRQNGNSVQWDDAYPSREILQKDIDGRNLYVICDEQGRIHAVFAFIIGEDSTYAQIEQGAWLSDAPYGTIHRIASDGTTRGVFSQCITFCKDNISHLRIDTHEKNQKMQELIAKHGFSYCCIITVGDGTPRNAYELIEV